MNYIDPKKYGLTKATVITKEENIFSFILKRKSRFIMKDAETLLKKIEKIKDIERNASFILKTNAPVCRKSETFLNENRVRIEEIH